MIKYSSMVLVLLITACMAALAQDAPKTTLHITAGYNRENVKIREIRNEPLQYDQARDGVGGEIGLTFAPTSGPLVIGMSAGVFFHNRPQNSTVTCGPGCLVTSTGTSKVQKGYFQYETGLQDRKGNFQPGAAALIGLRLGNFGGRTTTQNGSFAVGGGTKYYVGGKGWIDINLHKKKVFWRTGLQVSTVIGSSSDVLDVQANTGLAFKW